MATVKMLLEKKEKGFWTVIAETTAYEALQIMAERDVGAVMVVRGSRLLGIFTERDYSRKVVLKGRSSRETPVGELMTTSVYCVTPEDTTEQCMALMDAKHVRHLPVLSGGHLVGLVSVRDVVKMIISEKEEKIRDLEHYIASG